MPRLAQRTTRIRSTLIDTIEDGLVTVFLEQDGEEVGDAVLDVDTLPVETRRADAILTVEVTDGTLTQVTYEPDRGKSRKQAAQDRFDRLSSRPPCDDDST